MARQFYVDLRLQACNVYRADKAAIYLTVQVWGFGRNGRVGKDVKIYRDTYIMLERKKLISVANAILWQPAISSESYVFPLTFDGRNYVLFILKPWSMPLPFKSKSPPPYQPTPHSLYSNYILLMGLP